MVKRNFNEVPGFSLYRGDDASLLLPTAIMEELEEQAQAALSARVEDEAKRRQAAANEAEMKKQMQQARPMGKVAKCKPGERDIEILTPSSMSEFLDNVFRMDSVQRQTASTRASSIVRGAPGRGASKRPSSRRSTNRARHFETVCCVTRSRAATTLLSHPSAQASTMRARNARDCAVLRRLFSAISCSRSVALNTNGVFGLPLIATSSCNTLHD